MSKGIRATLEGPELSEPQATFDKVLVAVGRRPNSRNLGLEKCGVQVDDKGFIKIDERRRTTVPFKGAELACWSWGEGPAVLLKAGSAGVTLTNCHIHQSKGVRIEAGTSRITLRNNHIHHNRAASVTVGGGADSTPPAREIAIEGNRIHNDHGPALDLSRCQGVTLARNRLSNYRPDPEEGTTGEAIVIRSGCRDVRFESNSVLEASFAVRIGAGPGPAPERIFFSRNYFENQLTSDSTALLVEGGREIRFWNNVVNHYAEPFRIAAAGAPGGSVANNLVLQPTIAFRLPGSAATGFFDYNVFGAGPSLSADLGAGPVPAATWMAAHMGDLGKVQGFSPIDAGKAFEGMSFQGSAPDIGVAEK